MESSARSQSVLGAGPHLLDGAWPLLLGVGPMAYDDETMAQMTAQYQRFFDRGDRYAVISTNRAGATSPNAKARRAIADWAGSPRVKKVVSELCIGSATVARGALERGTLTAIFWLWRPPCPYQIAASHEEAVDWTIERLIAAKVPLPLGPDGTRRKALSLLSGV